jgi:hypothetical protein
MPAPRLAILLLVVTVSASLGVALDAGADPRCPGLVPDHGPLGFRRRTGGDRCEGFFRSNVSGEALSVAFLLSGRLPASAEVEISSAGPNREINVRAVALPLGTYYQMDATIGPKKPLRWPLSEVVQASQSLKVGDLGVYGWFGDAAHPMYVPVRADVPDGGPVADPQPVSLGVRANVRLDLVRYNITDDVSCRFSGKPWRQLATDVQPGKVLTLVLPRDRPTLCVSFRGKPVDSNESEPLTARIHLR